MQFARHVIHKVAEYSGISAAYKYKYPAMDSQSISGDYSLRFKCLIKKNDHCAGPAWDIIIACGQTFFQLLNDYKDVYKRQSYICLTGGGTGERHSRLFDRILLTKWMVQRLRLHLLDCGGTGERHSRLFDRILLTKWIVQRLRLHPLDWERDGWTTF